MRPAGAFRVIRSAAALAMAVSLSASAQTPAPQSLDLNESGRVLAQLDDVRAIFFVLILVIVFLMGLLVWALRSSSSASAKSIDKLAASIEHMTSVIMDRTTAELVHNARVESVMARIEDHLFRKGEAHDW